MNERTIFMAALEYKDPASLAAFLDGKCGDDKELRERIEALLRSHRASDSFMHVADSEIIAPTIDTSPIAEQAGTYIGSYKLVEEIGEGGMGSVFMALQKKPVRRTVALKVIKPGMDSKQVVSRFEAERQALALMDHPNIAKVHDGGTTESGRPYFVMELVKGIPITEYCDGHRLTNRERLELFRDVCSAVHHAHQKGIIHRDLKPSNVLVTQLDNTKPLPKIIDFGIAKATSGHLMDESLVTGISQLVGTPMYMSPEQAELTANDVDTRSDVYSLGVLLYELLTGVTPFDQDRMSSVSFDEVRRIVQEEDPPRPSTRLSTLDAALETVAEQRHTDARTLSHEVNGELDWIVMKALEKDRSRRYESASDFAKDIQRYLEDNPVEACPPSTMYRLRKFARRNRMAIAFASVLLLSLLVGIGGTTWMALKAKEKQELAEIAAANEEKQRKEAEQQRERAKRQEKIAKENFEQARAAVDEYLTRVSQEKLLNAPGLQPLRKDLLELALRYYQAFVTQRADDPNLRAELAMAYQRMASITHSTGAVDEAIKAAKEGLDIHVELVTDHPEDPGFQNQLAGSYLRLGLLYHDAGDVDTALNLSQQALEVITKLAAQDPHDLANKTMLANQCRYHGTLQVTAQRYDQARVSYRKAIAIQEQLVDERPNQPSVQSQLAASVGQLALLEHTVGNKNEALACYVRAIEIQKRMVNMRPGVIMFRSHLGTSYYNLGNLQRDMGKPVDAMESYRESININEKLADSNPDVVFYRNQLALNCHNLGMLLKDAGQADEALALYQKAIQLHKTLLKEAPAVLRHRTSLSNAYNTFGVLLRANKQPDKAQEAYEAAIGMLKELVAEYPEDPEYQALLAQTYNNLGNLTRDEGLSDKAIECYRKAIEIRERLTSEHPEIQKYRSTLAGSCWGLGNVHRSTGRIDDAIELFRKAISIQEELLTAVPENMGVRMSLVGDLLDLGNVQLIVAKQDDAKHAFEQVTAVIGAVAEAERTPAHWGNLGQALYRLGRWQEAREALETGINLRNETTPTISGGSRWWYLTMALAQLGERDKARSFYDKLVSEFESQVNPSEASRQLCAEAAELLGIEEDPAERPNTQDETNSIMPNEKGKPQ